MWLSTSGMDYDGTSVVAGFTTSGWFLFGIPIEAVLGLAFAAGFALLARKLRHVVGWSALLVAGGTMILLTFNSGLPQERLKRIVGADAAQAATIHRLHEFDSLNDGTTTYGVLSGSDGLFESIIADRGLKGSSRSPAMLFRPINVEETLPDTGEVYEDQLSAFYLHPDSGRIYFRSRSRPPTP